MFPACAGSNLICPDGACMGPVFPACAGMNRTDHIAEESHAGSTWRVFARRRGPTRSSFPVSPIAGSGGLHRARSGLGKEEVPVRALSALHGPLTPLQSSSLPSSPRVLCPRIARSIRLACSALVGLLVLARGGCIPPVGFPTLLDPVPTGLQGQGCLSASSRGTGRFVVTEHHAAGGVPQH